MANKKEKHETETKKFENDTYSQNENNRTTSEEKFDWDWILDKGWLRTKK